MKMQLQSLEDSDQLKNNLLQELKQEHAKMVRQHQHSDDGIILRRGGVQEEDKEEVHHSS